MKHIHIISPASAIDSQWIKRASLRLEQWGFRVSVAQHAYGNIGRFSATDEERVADLNAAFADPTIDIILCSRGGYGLQRIIAIGFGALNTALPATKTSAPAFQSSGAHLAFTPPSTSIKVLNPSSSIVWRR